MQGGLRVTSRSPEETLGLGKAVATVLAPGDVVSLSGDLGAGKTVFVKGVAGGLDVTSPVTSPSFTLVNEYRGRHRVRHLDVYRLNSIQEVLDLGFEELVDPSAVLLIEWGAAVAPLLPTVHLDVEMSRSLDPEAEQERVISLQPRGPGWRERLGAIRERAETLLAGVSGASLGHRLEDAAPLPPRDQGDGEPRRGET